MPKRRRKLSKELEHHIKVAIKRVEFITAVINDINDEDIQMEYIGAFEPIKASLVILSAEYDANGVTPISEQAFRSYSEALIKFEEEYEL